MSDLSEFGLRTRTQIAHERLRTALHEHVLQMATTDDSCAEDVVVCARQAMILSQRLKVMAVLKARVVYEATWEEVAELLGIPESITARKIYEDAEQRWLSGDLTPWMPQARNATVRPLLRRVWGKG